MYVKITRRIKCRDAEAADNRYGAQDGNRMLSSFPLRHEDVPSLVTMKIHEFCFRVSNMKALVKYRSTLYNIDYILILPYCSLLLVW